MERIALSRYDCDFWIIIPPALVRRLPILNDNANFKNDLHAWIFNEALVGK